MSNNTSPSENEQLKKEVATLRRNSIIWGIFLAFDAYYRTAGQGLFCRYRVLSA